MTVAKGVQRVPDKAYFVQYRAAVRHKGILHDLGLYKTIEEASEAVSDFRSENAKVSQGQWSKDNRTTTGIGYFIKRRKEILNERKNCNRCDKFLLGLTKYEWCVHHMDHDRTNNDETNFELLCKRCHQLEHCKHSTENGQYIQGSTTIPEGSTAKRLEAVGTREE